MNIVKFKMDKKESRRKRISSIHMQHIRGRERFHQQKHL